MKKRRFLILTLISPLLLMACQTKRKEKVKGARDISIGELSIELPKSYHFIQERGIDSYAAYIVNGRNDSFQIDYGNPRTIFRLFERPPVAWPTTLRTRTMQASAKAANPDNVVYSKTWQEDNEEGIFMENYHLYDTINGLTVKFVLPKRPGKGMTGMLVLDLPDSNCMSIYARNLDTASQDSALAFFRTVRLKE
ncbi:MAG TPA: hypothetical protein VGQ51_06575 [Puia sp.]|jgi:hypothetical protein|nr:hypothetical protein [Puia sp.]